MSAAEAIQGRVGDGRMSRPTLQELRQGLASAIEDGVEMTVYTYPVIEDIGETPAVVIEPAGVDFTGAMGGASDFWVFNLFVVVGRNDAESDQDALDGLLSGYGPNSIRQAIANKDDLGLGDVDAMVISMSGYGGSFKWFDAPHTGAILRARVLVS